MDLRPPNAPRRLSAALRRLCVAGALLALALAVASMGGRGAGAPDTSPWAWLSLALACVLLREALPPPREAPRAALRTGRSPR